MCAQHSPKLERRELATVLAALRHWQRTAVFRSILNGRTFIRMEADPEAQIATNQGQINPLDPLEIDTLCERLNE